MTRKVVVFGSINVDFVLSVDKPPKMGETIKSKSFSISEGGKGSNQAVSCGKLSGNVDMIGCVGNDELGCKIINAISKNNVGTKYIRKIDGVNTSSAIIIKSLEDNQIILGNGANDYLTCNDLEKYISENDVSNAIFITQLENNIDEIFKAIRLAKSNLMYTIFNPAPACKFDFEILNYVDLLILNQSETEVLTDIYPYCLEDCINSYNKLKKIGLKNLIITLGKNGSIVIENGKTKVIDGVIVNAIDTTGAGDSYIGAISYSLSQGNNLFFSAQFASIASSISVMRVGTYNAMPTINEVEDFKKRYNDDKEKINN